MNNQPILFIHSRDQNSAKVIETLKQLNKDSLCRMFYIDGKQRHELPAFLKSVPTLYVPESKDVYIGKEIYSYIAKPVVSRREVPVSPAQQAAQNPQAPKEYQAWSFNGTGSLTESFSSWESPNKFTTDDQLNYSFLGGSMNSPAPPEPQTKQSFDGNKQGRNDDISSRMEQMKKARESEFKGIARQ